MKYINILIIILFCSCSHPKAKKISVIKEFAPFDYCDSTSLNSKGNYCILINQSGEAEILTSRFRIRLLKRDKNGWELRQVFDSIESMTSTIETKFVDYNNDSIKDFLLSKGSGARGSNEYFYLFLFDKMNEKLLLVKGSDEITNLDMNYLDKIVGTAYSGGVSFGEYKLINDSIVETGGKDVSGEGEWTFQETYKVENGQRIIIKRDSIKDNGENLNSGW